MMNLSSTFASSPRLAAATLFTGAATRPDPARQGTVPAVMGILGNETSVMFGDLFWLMPHVRRDRLKALGITSATLSKLAPDIAGWTKVVSAQGIREVN